MRSSRSTTFFIGEKERQEEKKGLDRKEGEEDNNGKQQGPPSPLGGTVLV